MPSRLDRLLADSIGAVIGRLRTVRWGWPEGVGVLVPPSPQHQPLELRSAGHGRAVNQRVHDIIRDAKLC